MHRTARRFLELGEPIEAIVTSPLVRAVQTAEILATGLGFSGPLAARHRIAEPASFADLLEVIDEAQAQRLILVGHEPTLSSFTAHLLGKPLPRGYSTGTLYALSLDGTRAQFRWAWFPDEDAPTRSLT